MLHLLEVQRLPNSLLTHLQLFISQVTFSTLRTLWCYRYHEQMSLSWTRQHPMLFNSYCHLEIHLGLDQLKLRSVCRIYYYSPACKEQLPRYHLASSMGKLDTYLHPIYFGKPPMLPVAQQHLVVSKTLGSPSSQRTQRCYSDLPTETCATSVCSTSRQCSCRETSDGKSRSSQ